MGLQYRFKVGYYWVTLSDTTNAQIYSDGVSVFLTACVGMYMCTYVPACVFVHVLDVLRPLAYLILLFILSWLVFGKVREMPPVPIGNQWL